MKHSSATSPVIVHAHVYHDALRERRIAVRFSDGTEIDKPLAEIITSALRSEIAGSSRDAVIEECIQACFREGDRLRSFSEKPNDTSDKEARGAVGCTHALRALQGRTPLSATADKTPWILTGKELPDHGNPVIVYQGDASHTKRVAYYDTIGATGWHWCDISYARQCAPEAWMPIPEFK